MEQVISSKSWQKPVLTELSCIETFGGDVAVQEDISGFMAS